jgi:hypothetical protein
MSAKTLALAPTAPESFHNTAYSDGLQKDTDGVFAAILSGVPLIIALPNSLPRITRPSRIGWQRVDIHIGMPDQRDSLPDRLGPDEAVAL